MKILLPMILIIALLAVVIGTKGIQKSNSPQPLPSTTSANEKHADYPRETVIATGLDTPWAIAVLPDGALLVTERPGRVRLINAAGKLIVEPLLTLSDVATFPQGEAGLLGIAVHPNFSNNHFVYLYYTYAISNGEDKNRLVRYTLTNNVLVNPSVLLENVPGNVRHDGGRLKFGPDGDLYLTTGDSLVPSLAQDKTSLAGKILRLTDDGKPAPGNPFNNAVYSYGHRNPQGIAWDSTNQLYEVEHGDSAHDEINKITAGGNYGWPIIQGDETNAEMVTPLKNSESETWAPSGLSYLNGAFYFGELKGTALGKVTISGTTVDYTTYLKNDLGRIRDSVTGPDGTLYITTSNRDGRGTPDSDDDKVIRINPLRL